MKLIMTFLFTIFIGVSFAQEVSHVIFPPPILPINYPDFTNFCEVPNHKNKLVYTRFIYSGLEEYWNISSPEPNCKSLNSSMDIPDSIKIKKRYLALLKSVHENYWKSYLIIDAIGFFKDDKVGYGHLGIYKSEFVIKQIFNIQKVEKNINNVPKSPVTD